MSLQIARSVNFGSRRGSLSTVGYTLINADGSEKQARTTSGITELISSKGLYGGLLTFDNDFSGFLIWDTGQATPIYSMDQIDYRSFAEGGGVAFSTGIGGNRVWTKEEKEKILKQSTKILKIVKKIQEKDNSEIIEAVSKIIESNKRIIIDSNKNIVCEINKQDMRENIEVLYGALEALLEYKKFENILEEVEKNVEIRSAKIEG